MESQGVDSLNTRVDTSSISVTITVSLVKFRMSGRCKFDVSQQGYLSNCALLTGVPVPLSTLGHS